MGHLVSTDLKRLCESCSRAKLIAAVLKHEELKANHFYYCKYADIVGPFSNQTLEGYQY